MTTPSSLPLLKFCPIGLRRGWVLFHLFEWCENSSRVILAEVPARSLLDFWSPDHIGCGFLRLSCFISLTKRRKETSRKGLWLSQSPHFSLLCQVRAFALSSQSTGHKSTHRTLPLQAPASSCPCC